LLSPKKSKTAWLAVWKEAGFALTVLQTLYLFCVRSLPTEDKEQLGGTRTLNTLSFCGQPAQQLLKRCLKSRLTRKIILLSGKKI
jgi:hypothetical protein